MTAAGVQNTDSAAYLPPPPSTSTPDAKGAGVAGKSAADPQASGTSGEPSGFQSELELQQTGRQATDPSGPQKTGSAKTGKKRNTPPDTNPSPVTPVPVAEPQKPILPFSLALAQPQENAQLDQKPLKQSVKFPQPVEALPDPIPGANVAPSATPDSTQAQVLLASSPPLAPEILAREKPGAPSGNQPVSLAGLRLPATPAEPVASAVQETVDSASSSPSALAFAARISAVQKAGQPVAADPTQSPAVSSQASAQIPVRYPATAQILQSGAKTQQDETKKDAGAFIEKSGRPDARTDMVLPRFEVSSEPTPNSGSAAPQQAAPSARPEAILDPPAAAPTSSHDIRVRVPDNNGGSTQVRFVESGGEVRVSVRTADEGLAQNLRTHLNDLTQRLSDGGMPAEIWKPASSAASSQNEQQQPQPDGRGSGGQGSGGQSGQQDRQQKRPAWLDEMEASLHGEQN